MATTGNTNNQTKYFGGNGSINLQSIRDTFGGNNKSISFSKYYRKTDKNIQTAQFGSTTNNAFIPDATENETIPTSGGISFSDFRGDGDTGVIKQYVIQQTGSNQNYNISSGSDVGGRWNGNLSKNVPKTARISGRCYSLYSSGNWNSSSYPHSSSSAAIFNAEAYNLDIDIDSDTSSNPNSANNSNNGPRGVFGSSGVGGTNTADQGTSGGTALYVKQNSNRSNAVINVNLGNGRVFAGGGGGVAGRAGKKAKTIECIFYSTKSFGVHGNTVYNPGKDRSSAGGLNFRANTYCNTKAKGCGNQKIGNVSGDVYAGNCSGSRNRSRCRNSKGGNRSRGTSICFGYISKTCTFEHVFAGNSPNAASAGQGGDGKGAANISTNEGLTSGGNGQCSTCPDKYEGYNVLSGDDAGTCGTKGNDGSQGGTYGQRGSYNSNRSSVPGQGGHAVYSNTKSQVKVNSSSKAKGKLNNVKT